MRASVIIPAYEREEPLAVALESLLAQDFPKHEYEIVVSDDGSSPAVERCVGRYVGRDVAVRWHWGPNAGPGVARNRGASVARGEVLAFIDSDCIAPPSWLERIVRRAEQDGAAYGPVTSPIPALPPFVHGFDLTNQTKMGTGNFAVRKTAFDAIGGFDESVSYVAEDWDIAARLRRAGHPPAYVEEAAITHPLRLNEVRSLRMRLRDEIRATRGFRDLCRRAPEYRRDFAVLNRRAFARAGAKAALTCAFLPLAPVFPPAVLGSCAVGVLFAAKKRLEANRALEKAGESLRVPWQTAIRFGVQWPVTEMITCAVRASMGIAFVAP